MLIISDRRGLGELGAQAASWQDFVPASVKAKIKELTGDVPNDISDLFPKLTAPVPPPSELEPPPGPWVQKADGIYSGVQKIIALDKSGQTGVFVHGVEKGVTDAFKALGASAQVRAALGANTAAGIAIATALAQGQPMAAVSAGLDALSGVLAPIAPWGTAAAVAIQAGKLLAGFMGGGDESPPLTLGGEEWAPLRLGLTRGPLGAGSGAPFIGSPQQAEVVGKFIGGLPVAGADVLAPVKEPITILVRERMRQIFRARASGKSVDEVKAYPSEYALLALVLVNCNDAWRKPSDPWFTPLDVQYAYEMVSFALPRSLLYNLLVMTSLYSISWADRSQSPTGKRAQDIGRDAIQVGISQKMFPPASVEGGVYVQRAFPTQVAKRFFAHAPARLDLSINLSGLGVKNFAMGSGTWWRVDNGRLSKLPPVTKNILLATGHVEKSDPEWEPSAQLIPAPADMFRRAQLLAASDPGWMPKYLSGLEEKLADQRRLEESAVAASTRTTVAVTNFVKLARVIAKKQRADAKVQAQKDRQKVAAQTGTGSGGLVAGAAAAYALYRLVR